MFNNTSVRIRMFTDEIPFNTSRKCPDLGTDTMSRPDNNVKHEIFAAVKFCSFSILNFSRDEIFADF